MQFFLVFLLAFLNVSHADTISHLKVAHWASKTPNIVLCDNINISDDVINTAVDRWKHRGINIGKVIRRNCRDKPSHGEIAFYVNDRIVGSNAGWTVRSVYTNTDKIAYARIWIRSYNVNSLILVEHELGHGLGYKDTRTNGSIMSAKGSIY